MFVTKIEECEIGKGWEAIVEPLLVYANANGINIMQIKTKFAGLRVYYAHKNTFYDLYGNYTKYHTEEFDKMVAEAEGQAAVTCETCGEPGTRRTTGWFYVACDKHIR